MNVRCESASRALLVGSGLGLAALCVVRQSDLNASAQAVKARDADPAYPPPFQVRFPVTGTTPRDPANGDRGLAALYPLLKTYIARHNGVLTGDISDFYKDVYRNLAAYSVTEAQLNAITHNDDARYADTLPSLAARQDLATYLPYSIVSTRPDGTPTTGAGAGGAHDVLAYTDIYLYPNRRHHAEGGELVNPTGAFRVLWDNGAVMAIPYDQMVYALQADGVYRLAFPNQAGLPQDALTYEQLKCETQFARHPKASRSRIGSRDDNVGSGRGLPENAP